MATLHSSLSPLTPPSSLHTLICTPLTFFLSLYSCVLLSLHAHTVHSPHVILLTSLLCCPPHVILDPQITLLVLSFSLYSCHPFHITLLKSISSHLPPCVNVLMSSSSYFTRLTMPFYVTLFVSSSLTFPSLHHCPHVIVCISLHPLLFLITSSSSCHPHHLTLLTSPSTRHHRLTLFMSPSPVILMSPFSCHSLYITLK